MKSLVEKYIIDNKLIDSGSTLICGVSGGADSVFMLHILNLLKVQLNFDIVVCHVHHGIRGAEADRDFEFTKKLAKDLNLKFESSHVSMSQYAKENSLSEEEAGRILRMKFFKNVCKDYKKPIIALAHNWDDQAETVLHRIIRGTGIRGLKGIEAKRANFIRPILNCRRKDIENYLSENSIEYMTDSTNLENIYMRNRLRLDIIPKLEEINPAFKDSLVRISKIADEAYDLIDFEARKHFEDICECKADKIVLNIEKLKSIKPILQKEIIFLAIEFLKRNRDNITETHLNSVLNLLDLETGSKANNIPGISIIRNYDTLEISLNNLDSDLTDFDFEIIDGKNYYPIIDCTIEYSDYKNINKLLKDRFTFIVDLDKIKGGLKIRNRKAGDRIKPINMGGTKKLKDIFIDAKLDKRKRDSIPIVYDDEKIIWIVGFVKSDEVKVDEDTSRYKIIKFGGYDA